MHVQMPYLFAFTMLGFLTGNLIGLTRESVVNGFLPLLFAFGGGSIVAFLGKIDEDIRPLAAWSLGYVCLSCIGGIYFALLVVEHQWLTPSVTRIADQQGISSIDARKLLRSDALEKAVVIDQQVRNGQLSYEEAYDELQMVVQEDR